MNVKKYSPPELWLIAVLRHFSSENLAAHPMLPKSWNSDIYPRLDGKKKTPFNTITRKNLAGTPVTRLGARKLEIYNQCIYVENVHSNFPKAVTFPLWLKKWKMKSNCMFVLHKLFRNYVFIWNQTQFRPNSSINYFVIDMSQHVYAGTDDLKNTTPLTGANASLWRISTTETGLWPSSKGSCYTCRYVFLNKCYYFPRNFILFL